jgi:hypothetical protein
MSRKPGTDTEFPAHFAGNWLSVPGFAPRDTPLPPLDLAENEHVSLLSGRPGLKFYRSVSPFLLR